MRTYVLLTALALSLARPVRADDSAVVPAAAPCELSESSASERGAERSSPTARDSAACASVPPDAPQSVTDEQAAHALELELARNIGKQTQESDYPQEARRKGWSGTTLVQVVMGADGTTKQVSVGHTSGFQVLDDQALRMVLRAPPAHVPDQLKGHEVTLTVPIGFYFVGQ
jgi:periplasmic protein TonB